MTNGGPPSNYSPANLEQLKWIAWQARYELEDGLVIHGGAGENINNLVNSFAVNRNPEKSMLNIGQLKAIAKPFYDRLNAVGYDLKYHLKQMGYAPSWAYIYPWNPNTPVSENYVPANIGQLKLVFSFDLKLDTNGNGVPDWIDGNYRDTDGDGLADTYEVNIGLNPLSASTQNNGINDNELVIANSEAIKLFIYNN